MLAQAGILGHVTLADDDRDWLVGEEFAAVASRGEARVVGQHCSGADQDRVA